jgi:hypothetical protein
MPDANAYREAIERLGRTRVGRRRELGDALPVPR